MRSRYDRRRRPARHPPGSRSQGKRHDALGDVVRALGTPVGHSTMRRSNTDKTITATFTMYCSTGCASENPVKRAATWLSSSGFSAATSEDDVALCFDRGCTVTATRTTDAGQLNLSARLATAMQDRRFRIEIRGTPRT